jgi:hypothetical protein
MTFDRAAAASFLASHGRTLDWRRFHADTDGVLAALDGYRNADGGYGWGLEPDLRSPASQPAAAMHALEVLAEVGPVTSPRAVELCDWLEVTSVPDGGLPFALPVEDAAGSAPWWTGADHTTSSLQITAQVVANAHLVAAFDPAVAAHPWLARATAWCLDAIGAAGEREMHAYELLFSVRLLDALGDADGIDRLADRLPPEGLVPVAGGVEGEVLRPLKFAPEPGRPARRLFADDVVAADLDRLVGLQQPDGGWVVDFPSSSPVAELEWRGYATVEAVHVLTANA